LMAYTEAWQLTHNPLFKQTTQQIATYLLRDLQDDTGALFSAEDAVSEGEEGSFYVWTTDEVQKVLDEDDAELAIKLFNLQPEGNYTDEATGRQTGKNILHLTKPIAEWAAELKWSIE